MSNLSYIHRVLIRYCAASNDLVLIRPTLYELCTISGESLRTKLFEFNEEGAVHMVVSPDGMFAIRAQYECKWTVKSKRTDY